MYLADENICHVYKIYTSIWTPLAVALKVPLVPLDLEDQHKSLRLVHSFYSKINNL